MPRPAPRTILTTLSALLLSALAGLWVVSALWPRLPSRGIHLGGHRVSVYHGRILFTTGADPAAFPIIDATSADLGPAIFFHRTGDSTDPHAEIEAAYLMGRTFDHT